jgi:hypothetical protein
MEGLIELKAMCARMRALRAYRQTDQVSVSILHQDVNQSYRTRKSMPDTNWHVPDVIYRISLSLRMESRTSPPPLKRPCMLQQQP